MFYVLCTMAPSFTFFSSEDKSQLSFQGITSLQIQKKLKKLFIHNLTSCDLKIVFKTPIMFKGFLTFKEGGGFSTT